MSVVEFVIILAVLVMIGDVVVTQTEWIQFLTDSFQAFIAFGNHHPWFWIGMTGVSIWGFFKIRKRIKKKHSFVLQQNEVYLQKQLEEQIQQERLDFWASFSSQETIYEINRERIQQVKQAVFDLQKNEEETEDVHEFESLEHDLRQLVISFLLLSNTQQDEQQSKLMEAVTLIEKRLNLYKLQEQTQTMNQFEKMTRLVEEKYQ